MAIDNLRLEFVPWARPKRIKVNKIPTSLFIVVTDAFFIYVFLYIFFYFIIKDGSSGMRAYVIMTQIAYIKVNVFCRCMKLTVSYIAKFDGFKFITVLSCFSSVPASLS